MTVLFVYAATIGQLMGCSTSPTGREQFIVVSNSEMSTMGRQSFDELKKKVPIEREARVNAYVKCVAQAVAVEAKDGSGVTSWEVVVFRDATANAFALPGGKIGVHTGLLKVATTPDQLAAVLGHEVGHVIARHGAERVSQGLATQSGLILADAMLDKQNSSRGMILGAIGLGAQFGVLLPFSRKHESEADEIGQVLMARAGFNPEESIVLWQNMSKASKGAPPEFMSTHPANSTRIDGLHAHMGEARKLYQQALAAGHAPNCRM